MGMMNEDIPNENIQASSELSSNYVAGNARLNGQSFWATDREYINPWIQADIGYQTWVSGIITQGGGPSYVTFLKISTFSISISDAEVFIDDGIENVMVNIQPRVPFAYLWDSNFCIKNSALMGAYACLL